MRIRDYRFECKKCKWSADSIKNTDDIATQYLICPNCENDIEQYRKENFVEINLFN